MRPAFVPLYQSDRPAYPLRGTEKFMFRVQVIVTAAAIAMGTALAGCSNSPLSMQSPPDWLTPKPPPQTLQFKSEPPGAEVRTAQGPTCLTPCSLAVPVSNQSVTVTLIGYVPQTLQVEVGPSGNLVPNPVEVALQAVPPPIKPVLKPRKKPVRKTAAKLPAPHPRHATAPKTPPAQGTLDDRVPPTEPPSQPAATSPFPPSPETAPTTPPAQGSLGDRFSPFAPPWQPPTTSPAPPTK